MEDLGSWNVEMTDQEFSASEDALNACTVHGHRGHVESDQTSFGKNWGNSKS